MIDTVALTLDHGLFFITKPQLFSPSLDVYSKKYVQNPTAADYRAGRYKPCLTLYNYGGAGSKKQRLRIQFSLPKLLFGNNIDEVGGDDFDRSLSVLQTVLVDMGVKVFSTILEHAKVSVLHICKNIPLSDHYTASLVINELRKIAAPKRFDTNIRDFRNDGLALYFYNASHSVILYDKIADLKKPKARAIDKEKTLMQLNMFDILESRKQELLRLEIRFQTKKKLDSTIQQFGFPSGITFRQIFSNKLCSAILSQYWTQYLLPFTGFSMFANKSGLVPFSELVRLGFSANDAMLVYGFQNLISDVGIHGIQAIFNANYCQKTWDRLEKKMKKLTDTIVPQHGNPPWVGMIETRLNSTTALRLERIGLGR